MGAYKVWNGPAPTAAAQQAVTSNPAIQTLLQLATPADMQIRIVSWGFSADDPANVDGVIELLETDVAATVTAHVASGLVKLDPNAPNSRLTLGTSATGYTATAEGTIAATRVFDAVSLSSTSGESPLVYVCQLMPVEMPIIAVSRFCRVRITTGLAIRTWITYEQL